MANTAAHTDHSGGESVTLRSSFVRSVGLFNAALSSSKVLVRYEIPGGVGGGCT